MILREKDLDALEYANLAERAFAVCGARLTLHGVSALPLLRRVPRAHCQLSVLKANPWIRARVKTLGVSVHSPKDARLAQSLGADYVTAGHVFDTACKNGVPGRGLAFLRETVSSVRIPVYAIGGISAENAASVRRAGAAGACVMSGLMLCPDAKAVLSELRRAAGIKT